MMRFPRASSAVLLVMVLASGLAFALKPRDRVADIGPKVDLSAIIPLEFGPWHVDPSITPLKVSPEVQRKLDEIYSQTLSRTYIDSAGHRVMLSIAYGSDQSDAMQVHRPEICYPAQGFSVLKTFPATLNTAFGTIPASRLVAVQGARVEPITYWITVGDKAARGGWEQKVAQLRYGLTGKVPDGALFRVSTIGSDQSSAFETQERFVQDLLNAVPASVRLRLAGAP